MQPRKLQTQSNWVSDFCDFVCSLFAMAILFDFYLRLYISVYKGSNNTYELCHLKSAIWAYADSKDAYQPVYFHCLIRAFPVCVQIWHRRIYWCLTIASHQIVWFFEHLTDLYCLVCLCLGFMAQSIQWGHVGSTVSLLSHTITGQA